MTQMNMINTDNYKHSEITEKIIKAFYKVYNTLGYGFLEKVYENALFFELSAMGLLVEKQQQNKSVLRRHRSGRIFCRLNC